MHLDKIVSSYILNYREAARNEARYFEDQRSLSAAIREATLTWLMPSSKKHPHQWRISRAPLEEGERRLQAASKRMKQAADFAALHQIVDSELGHIRGIAELTIYDIAHRLGAFLRKNPAHIYLHAGTRRGAAAFGLKGATIRPEELPAAFSKLTAAEIEDCLCIYEDELREELHKRRPRPTRGCRSLRLRGCSGVFR